MDQYIQGQGKEDETEPSDREKEELLTPKFFLSFVECLDAELDVAKAGERCDDEVNRAHAIEEGERHRRDNHEADVS